MNQETMNQAILDQWADALTSGKFPQGKGRLRTVNDEYCCLGVLCELAADQGVVERMSPEEFEAKFGAKPDGWHYGTRSELDTQWGERSTLPLSVQKWAGLSSCNPDVDMPGANLKAGGYSKGVVPDEATVAEFNDNGATFEQIAAALKARFGTDAE